MKKYLRRIVLVVTVLLAATCVFAPVESIAYVNKCNYGETYICPDDNCRLIWTGETNFCVGINCRTVKIYQCGCCGKKWGIYQ
jgi:hypothetical protein